MLPGITTRGVSIKYVSGLWMLAVIYLRKLLFFPLLKFFLPLLAVIERKNIREHAAGDFLDFVFGDIGFIDYFLFSGQADLHEDLTYVSTCTLLMNGPPVLFGGE